ncbi:Trans-aconitate 2-methyltransferase [Penicillium macrosclerotiorum]|uniref:Trans-aconitate 2-methyltransferase n=1 Tax=Penicillium macrosclerotiorum TaxID=303699 RepID=UPI002547F335|nr:Trans-aconitate 2-methyltransferase [Penicillium macrosclerotiorum]KAJ5666898.1 Trans-aconitate 2-methyltransferase [Penicillium macrosclerotiorum]
MSIQAETQPTHDWSAAQYLKFEDERTQPSRDLLARVPLQAPKNVVDLGCGPGNSTAVLETRYPNARITGMDSSPAMIHRARLALPHLDFTVEDLTTYSSQETVDLFFSNAVFQWLGRKERFGIVKRLMDQQPCGSVFALQVPDNLTEPCHVLMRETAKDGPWAAALATIGRETFQTPQEIYNLLKPISSRVDIWQTSYYHSLENHEAIIEWVKGTGLRPYLDPLQPGEKEQFLHEYLKRLVKAYPSTFDGRVLLKYPRLFVVAVKS